MLFCFNRAAKKWKKSEKRGTDRRGGIPGSSVMAKTMPAKGRIGSILTRSPGVPAIDEVLLKC